MFGEVALIDRKGRNAHCIAMKPTECGVLNYPDYSQVFKKMQELEQKVKKNFFERVVLKDQNLWDQAKLLMSFFDKSKYIRGQTLFKKGDFCQKVWIIIEGQVVLWDNVYRPDKVHHEIDDHLRNVSRVRIDLLILRDGEMVCHEGLFDDPKKDRCKYNASFDCETIVYEASKDGLKKASDAHQIIKQFLQGKVKQMKFLLEGMVREAQEDKKRIVLKGKALESSKRAVGPVNVVVKKADVLTGIQMVKLQEEFAKIGLTGAKSPRSKINAAKTSTKLKAEEDLDILEKVTRTKLDDNEVVSNKLEQYKMLVGDDMFKPQKQDDKDSSIYGQPKRREPNPTIDYLEQMASKSSSKLPIRKLMHRIKGVATGSQSELTDELYHHTLAQLQSNASATNLGYSKTEMPQSSILNDKSEPSELLLKSSRLFLPLPSEKQVYMTRTRKNMSLPVLKGVRSISPNSTERDFVVGADSSGFGSSIQSPSRTRVGFKVSAHSTTRNEEPKNKWSSGTDFYPLQPQDKQAKLDKILMQPLNSSQLESTDIFSPPKPNPGSKFYKPQEGYNLLGQEAQTPSNPGLQSPTKESSQKKTKFHHKIKSMNFTGPSTMLFKRRTGKLVIDPSSGRMMEKVTTEGNKQSIIQGLDTNGSLKYIGLASPTNIKIGQITGQRSAGSSTRMMVKPSLPQTTADFALESLRVHGSGSVHSIPKLNSPKSFADVNTFGFGSPVKQKNPVVPVRVVQ